MNADLQLPELQELVPRGEFLVYPKDSNGIHEIKSAEKVVLYKAKCESMGLVDNAKMVMMNRSGQVILTMDSKSENPAAKKEWWVTATPNIHIGKLNKDSKPVYEMIDHLGHTLYLGEKVVNRFHIDKYYKIMDPLGQQVGTIGDNKGDKLVLSIPAGIPVSHKALLLALTISYKDSVDNMTTVAAMGGGAC